MRKADMELRPTIEARAQAADRRKEQVQRRIERGDVQPRPLPGLREDSMASIESMGSAEYASGVTERETEAGGNMMEDVPLQGHMPIDPERAEEDLAQSITEDTGSGGIHTCTTSAKLTSWRAR